MWWISCKNTRQIAWLVLRIKTLKLRPAFGATLSVESLCKWSRKVDTGWAIAIGPGKAWMGISHWGVTLRDRPVYFHPLAGGWALREMRDLQRDRWTEISAVNLSPLSAKQLLLAKYCFCVLSFTIGSSILFSCNCSCVSTFLQLSWPDTDLISVRYDRLVDLVPHTCLAMVSFTTAVPQSCHLLHQNFQNSLSIASTGIEDTVHVVLQLLRNSHILLKGRCCAVCFW